MSEHVIGVNTDEVPQFDPKVVNTVRYLQKLPSKEENKSSNKTNEFLNRNKMRISE